MKFLKVTFLKKDAILGSVCMVQGIETNGKKYKHKKKNDVKWLAKDLNDIRKTAENYIDSKRPRTDNEINSTVKKSMKDKWSFIRIIAIILGIIGIFALIYGVYSLMEEVNILSIINTLIGIVFVLGFILFEKYR